MKSLALPRLPAMLFLLSLQVAGAAEPPPAPSAELIEAGRKIYEQGIQPNGEPLAGTREGGTVVSGADAACINCHRRTGLGSYEGSVIVPPVIGQALFGKFRKPGERAPRRTAGMKYLDFDFHTRPPYDDATLARALRTGVSTSGYTFRYLMPRYELDDVALQALSAYLRTLVASQSPGVESPYVHFASVIAPGIDASRRKIFLDTLRACFDERSPTLRGPAGEKGHGAGTQRWQLHVWELEGDPSTWKAQLEKRYAARPVFALLSGLGNDQWEPVHEFCARQSIPCLFPNTDVPGDGENFYNFYFSRGVMLDARVLARYLMDEASRLGIKRVVQVAGSGRAEAVSAAALRDALAASAIALEQRPFPGPAGDAGQPERHGFEDLGPSDALVLWLRQADLAAFAARLGAPPGGSSVFVSGRLVEPERVPLKPAWRNATRLVYPFDPPGRWALRVGFNLEPWLDKHRLPATDKRLQGSIVTACAILSESLGRTQGLMMRDYLVEAVEYLGDNSNAPATAPYPRFTLGPTQRAASKGGYVVRLGDAESGELVRDSDWIVP